MRGGLLIATTLCLLALAGCERAQTQDASARKIDAPAWATSEAANPGFAAAGFKPGDKTAWENQIHKRNQAQNDYVR
ncbi:hypothetical protein PEC18_27835 [Paucibacter sp. O1-1]|uniref:hypothetical protein n=1 Tax=Paucibacter sp. XJ19-41 TaxID=2927824 RepID=UPI0010F9BC94|nr:hypothetical protein [Paucibacter sp. XJ19-41]MCU7374549.1 hypothetical protein [Paucibacter sp. O1-1]MDA3829551.1 hypothetical protein [Paucibacter sp. O1-1]MDC6170608.1 hypothetical protein [Paucibacter sp. XJ19-41]